MDYGYTSASNAAENTEQQVRNIKEACPTAVIVEEVFADTTDERKKWKCLYDAVLRDDNIYFESVRRMGRNAEEGYAAYRSFYRRGVNLFFLKEPHINTLNLRTALSTKVPLNKANADKLMEAVTQYLLALVKEQIRLAFEQAENESEDLRQRIGDGIAAARLNGKRMGRRVGAKLETHKSVRTKRMILWYSRDFHGDLSDNELIPMVNVARNSYYKYKRELRESARQREGEALLNSGS